MTSRMRLDDIKLLIEKAITALHRCGYKSLTALACELFATFALAKMNTDMTSDFMVVRLGRVCKAPANGACARMFT
jgi:hypothetical protein